MDVSAFFGDIVLMFGVFLAYVWYIPKKKKNIYTGEKQIQMPKKKGVGEKIPKFQEIWWVVQKQHWPGPRDSFGVEAVDTLTLGVRCCNGKGFNSKMITSLTNHVKHHREVIVTVAGWVLFADRLINYATWTYQCQLNFLKKPLVSWAPRIKEMEDNRANLIATRWAIYGVTHRIFFYHGKIGKDSDSQLVR